ncbi:ribosomal-protein-alanine acetyltransferase, partial [gut metagenome]
MIRAMRKEDLEQIAALEKQCFSDPWPLDSLLYELEGNPFSTPYVLLDEQEENKIIGYAHLWVTFEQAQLANIAI